MTYQVGVDLGTTFTAAAICRPGNGPAEIVPLGQRARSVPSIGYLGADGALQIGEVAERRALSDPARVVREFKRRIGDPTPMLVGRDRITAEALTARFLSRVLQDVAAREGGPASRIAVTHPAGWGQHKLRSLRTALAENGLGSAAFVAEPQAAAIGYAHAERIEPGAAVAVYDLGGGTFDAAVVRRTPAGGFELLGEPDGIEQLGGLDLDEVVFQHVRAALGAQWEALDTGNAEVLAAVAGLRRECTAAKEALSHDTEVEVPVLLPGICSRVRLGRAEFEELIRPALAQTVATLRRVLAAAGVPDGGLGALLLVGGSSRIPLITQLLSDEFGRQPAVDADPKGVIAAGAALVARGIERAGGGQLPAPGGRRVGPTVAAADAAVGSSAPAAAVADRHHGRADGPAVDHRHRPGRAAEPSSATAPGAPEDPPHPRMRLAGAAPVPSIARPPKQARPFTAGEERAPSRRRTVLGLVAGVLMLVLLGGAVALGATRIGANREADASTPPTTAITGVAPAATAVEVTGPPAPTEAPPPPADADRPRRRAPAPPPAPVAPPPATTPPQPASTTAAASDTTTEPPPPAVDQESAPEGGNADLNGDAGNGGNGGNGGNDNSDEQAPGAGAGDGADSGSDEAGRSAEPAAVDGGGTEDGAGGGEVASAAAPLRGTGVGPDDPAAGAVDPGVVSAAVVAPDR